VCSTHRSRDFYRYREANSPERSDLKEALIGVKNDRDGNRAAPKENKEKGADQFSPELSGSFLHSLACASVVRALLTAA